MAHVHDHGHDHGDYYLEQLLTIGICAALGTVSVLWWVTGNINRFIDVKYHLVVLCGGLALLGLALVRGVVIWRAAGREQVHEHTHEHGHVHDHDHDHGCCGHDHAHEHVHAEGIQTGPKAVALPVVHGHDHGHDHGWAPWRFAVLLLPVVLYCLDLPNQGLANTSSGIDPNSLEGVKGVADKGFMGPIGFQELESAATWPDAREEMTGKTYALVGQFAGYDDRHFTLMRYKRTCCSADAYALKAMIVIDPSYKGKGIDPSQYARKWVKVTGRIEFPKDKQTGQYFPTFVVYPTEKQPLSKLVEIIPKPADEYLN